MDEMAGSVQESVFAISEIACDLFHPLAIRSRKDPGNLDPPSLEINNKENEIPNQTRARDHFDTEEVCSRDRAPNEPLETSPTTFPCF